MLCIFACSRRSYCCASIQRGYITINFLLNPNPLIPLSKYLGIVNSTTTRMTISTSLPSNSLCIPSVTVSKTFIRIYTIGLNLFSKLLLTFDLNSPNLLAHSEHMSIMLGQQISARYKAHIIITISKQCKRCLVLHRHVHSP